MDVLYRPALLLLLLPLVTVAVIVVVVVLATRSAGRSGAPPAQPGSVPPGWYPQADGSTRYWNGVAWTGDVRPPEGPPPAG